MGWDGYRLTKEQLRCRMSSSLPEYLDALKNVKNCIIIVVVKDTAGYWIEDSLQKKLAGLGLKKSLIKKFMVGYIGIINQGQVMHEAIAEKNGCQQFTGEIEHFYFELESKPFLSGNLASSKINGLEYAVNSRGLNIILFDISCGKVIDSVCFDTHVKELTCKRKELDFEYAAYTQIKLEEILYRLNQMECSMNPKQEVRAKRNIAQKDKERVERLKLCNILKSHSNNKKQIHIIWWGDSYFWNVLKSVCKAFQEDDSWHVKMIFYFEQNIPQKTELLKEVGIDDWVTISDYRIELESPDVLLVTTIDLPDAYPKERLEQFRDNSKLVVMLPHNLINNYSGTIWDFYKNAIETCVLETDYFIFDKLLYDEMKKEGLVISKIVLIGNPKFDEIYGHLKVKNPVLPEKWSKLQGKKVVLWTTDHVWDSDNIAVDLYIKSIIEYFSKNQDMALIFRPHKRFFEELCENEIWDETDLEYLKRYFTESVNMVLDESADYSLAFQNADAILTDARCGIIISGLCAEKPMGVLERYDCIVEQMYAGIIENYYEIKCEKECRDFLEMIKSGKDPRAAERQSAFRKYISHFDGKNGQRIKDFIAEKYAQRMSDTK